MWDLDVLDVLSHVGKSKITDHSHGLALKCLFRLLFLPTLFAERRLDIEVDLSLWLQLEELVIDGALRVLVLLLSFLLSDGSSGECHLLDLVHHFSLLIGKSHGGSHFAAGTPIGLLNFTW